MSERNRAREFASDILNQGIRAVAFDFDATALTFNTNPSTSYCGSSYFFHAMYSNRMSEDFTVSLVPELISNWYTLSVSQHSMMIS